MSRKELECDADDLCAGVMFLLFAQRYCTSGHKLDYGLIYGCLSMDFAAIAQVWARLRRRLLSRVLRVRVAARVNSSWASWWRFSLVRRSPLTLGSRW